MHRADTTPRLGLGRGLLFALFAALAALPCMFALSVLCDFDTSIGLLLLGLTPLHVLVIAPSWRRGLGAFLLAAGLCGVLVLSAPGLQAAALGTLVALGLIRSALLYPRPLARALVFELALALAAGVALALLHDGSLAGNALGVWSFWLVQSAFALLPGDSPARDPDARDPFETAAAAAERVMQGYGP
jgi:hypothetical protein